MFPTLSGPPIMGHLFEFRDRRLQLLRRAADAYDACWIRLAGMRVLLVSSADLAHEVLVQQPQLFAKGPVSLDMMPTVLGRGLLTAPAEPHRRQRKLLTPLFTPRRFSGHLPAVDDETARTTAAWRDGGKIDLAEELTRLTLRATLRTLFGAAVDDLDVIVESLNTALASLERSLTGLPPLPLSWPTPNNRRRVAAVARLDAIVHAIVAERRRAGRADGSLVQLLLDARDEAGSGLDDTEVRDQLVTFLAAGSDTLAHALAWSAWLLMTHPEAESRVRAEADALFADAATLPDEAPARLPFTTQVLKEAMRLYSPSYLHDRRAVADAPLGGRTVAAGTPVWINAWGIHYRAAYFPRPDRFDPERFAAGAQPAVPKHAFLPFGAGPRACIGAGLALASGPVMLARLLRDMRVTPLDPTRPVLPEPRFTIRPKGGLPVRVERRRHPKRSAAPTRIMQA
jgi:cytochrome P450